MSEKENKSSLVYKNTTKKKIDQAINSELFDDFDKFDHFFLSNWKKIVWSAVGILIVIAIIAGIYGYRENQRIAAAKALANAENIDELRAVIAKYPESPSANSAELRIASQEAAQGNYEAAIKELEVAIAADPDSEMSMFAAVQLGYLAELNQETEKAENYFAKVASNKEFPAYITAEANYQLGRLAVSRNDLAAAQEYLERVAVLQSEDMGTMLWRQQAIFLNNLISDGKFGTVAAQQ